MKWVPATSEASNFEWNSILAITIFSVLHSRSYNFLVLYNRCLEVSCSCPGQIFHDFPSVFHFSWQQQSSLHCSLCSLQFLPVICDLIEFPLLVSKRRNIGPRRRLQPHTVASTFKLAAERLHHSPPGSVSANHRDVNCEVCQRYREITSAVNTKKLKTAVCLCVYGMHVWYSIQDNTSPYYMGNPRHRYAIDVKWHQVISNNSRYI